jgi:CheY-like chemotaxis protein
LTRILPSRIPGIIIVDDVPGLVRVYEKFFEIVGLRVIATFLNANDMLEFLSNPIGDSVSREDLQSAIFLLDYSMPETNGEEAARKLRKINPRARIILATGHDLSRLHVEGGLFDALIQKPFSISELLQTIEKVVPTLINSMKGTRIFDNASDIDRLFSEITELAKEKICVCEDRARSLSRHGIPDFTPWYIRAAVKGVRIYLLTEITSSNLYYYKQLIDQLGVQIKHLKGVRTNFSITDGAHYTGALLIDGESKIATQVMYSNIDELVSSNQYLFDTLWTEAIPAENVISELAAKKDERKKVMLVSGSQKVTDLMTRAVKNTKSSLEICATMDRPTQNWLPGVRQACAEAIANGVRISLITEVTKEKEPTCKVLVEMGVNLRHLDGVKGGFLANETELLVRAAPLVPDEGLQYVYSNFPLIVEQHRSIFATMWNIATPISSKMNELEAERIQA